MNKNKSLLAICILILLGGTVYINGLSRSKEVIEVEGDIIASQLSIEEKFETEGYTHDNPNVLLNPYGNSPLTALIMFETKNEVTPEIRVKGFDELTTVRSIGKKTKVHYLPIYGLYPGMENDVIIKIDGEEKVVKIATERLPEDIALPTSVKAPDKSKLTGDFYFFTPSSKGYTLAYDVNGEIRWYLKDNMTWDVSRLENGRLLLSTDRQMNPPYFTTGLYEVDLLGKVYKEYRLPGGYHHDFYELKNGNLIIASNDFDNKEGTVEDVIVEVDRDSGNIVKTWDLKEVLNVEDGKSENWSNYDWFHNNSVWYNDKEDEIILSGRHQDAVIAIDYESGDLKWIIGDPNEWSEEYLEYFFTPKGSSEFEWQWSQHAAMITPEGYVFILDNGNNKSKYEEEYVPAEESYTRGVMYDIDREEMTIEQVWEYGKERGSEFYSPYISDVDYLGENHYIVHSGGIVYVDGKLSNQPAGFAKNAEKYSTTVELKDDEVIFEITLPTNMYRTEKMSLYSNSEFELGKGKRLGSFNETKYENTTNISSRNTLDVKEIDDEYELEIINEIDRLVVKGTFKKGKKVNVYLQDRKETRKYNVRVSKRPYTALCIDMFNAEEKVNGIEVVKNINKEGLDGKYSIFIQIDDDIYYVDKLIES